MIGDDTYYSPEYTPWWTCIICGQDYGGDRDRACKLVDLCMKCYLRENFARSLIFLVRNGFPKDEKNMKSLVERFKRNQKGINEMMEELLNG